MSKRPFTISAVKEREGQKDLWIRCGVAWPHEKGGGFNLELEALPLNFTGKLVLMPPKTTEAEG